MAFRITRRLAFHIALPIVVPSASPLLAPRTSPQPRVARTLAMDSANGATRAVIGTHNGAFHCDEALAVYLLRQTASYAGATVLRTRDASKLETADVVVDVGGVYDAQAQRFDHHQRSFNETFSAKHNVTKLSSAGLIYRHFGREVVRNHEVSKPLTDSQLQIVYMRVYDAFMEAIDAVDNGVAQRDGPARYQNSTDVSARVGRLNAPWNVAPDSKQADQDANFEHATALVGADFNDALVNAVTQWLPARSVVETQWRSRAADAPGGEILVLREWAPWKSHLFDLEKDQDGSKLAKVLYVVYQDSTKASWRVQCVPNAPQSFVSRKSLPEAWRGVRDDALTHLTGIDGCVFTHAAGFICGNKTFEGAMAMARKALED